jgi:DNA-binding MarR family transcriptional regulator
MPSSSPRTQRRSRKQSLDELAVWRSVADSWKTVQRAAEKNLLSAGLSFAELRILRVLRDQGSSPMNRFSAETLLSQPTITGVVDRLEERALVERIRNLSDRREVLIAITPKGNGVLALGEEVHKRFVERSFAVLHEGEMETLSALLKRLAEVADSTSKGAGMV